MKQTTKMNENEEKSTKTRFKTATSMDKSDILGKRKSENTNSATKLWISCLREYLIEKSYPELETLTDSQLSEILGNFYIEARKKRIPELETTDECDEDMEEKISNYKNSSLRAARAAFTRYFKDTRKIDIRTNELFIECNEIFLGKTKDNKAKGLGKVENKPAINDSDMQKLTNYFKETMRGPPIQQVSNK